MRYIVSFFLSVFLVSSQIITVNHTEFCIKVSDSPAQSHFEQGIQTIAETSTDLALGNKY